MKPTVEVSIPKLTEPSFFKTISNSSAYDKDEKEFQERVSTYIVGQKWVRRPLILSPAVCARYGWKCVSDSMLECVTCGAKMCTYEPLDISIMDNTFNEKILRALEKSHKTHCPWPLTPSPESFIKMHSMPKEEAQKFFLQRMESCVHLSSALPQIKNSAATELGLSKQQISALCQLAKVNDEDAQKFGISAVSLAVSGWTLVEKGKYDDSAFIVCYSCQRSVWHRSFNLLSASNLENTEVETSQNESTNVDDSPISRKRIKKEDFDPLEEHRPWCRWIGTETKCQSNKKRLSNVDVAIPGWKIFMKSLLRNVCDSDDVNSESTPTREQIRSVRDLLETWTDSIE